MCSCDYAEMPEFFDQKYVKARKEHKCCECPFPIEPGEKYWVSTGKWDGEVKSYRRHQSCEEASKQDCGMSAFTCAEEDFFECDLPKNDPIRKAWAGLKWRFRHHPKAKTFLRTN